MPIDKLHIHIDGGSRGNPGPAAAGVVFRDAGKDLTLYEAGHWIGRATNNVAEYSALLTALKLALPLKPAATLIHSDSELMVKQINGEYRVKSPDLQPLYAQAVALLRQLGGWKMVHVYREKNARADELANRSMDAGKTVIESPMVRLDGAAPAGESGEKKPAGATLFDAPAASAGKPAGRAESRPAAEPAAPTRSGPRFSLVFTRAPGAGCPAPCQSGREFAFARTVPAGLCVYAAAAACSAIAEVDDPADAANQVACPRCQAPMTLEVESA